METTPSVCRVVTTGMELVADHDGRVTLTGRLAAHRPRVVLTLRGSGEWSAAQDGDDVVLRRGNVSLRVHPDASIRTTAADVTSHTIEGAHERTQRSRDGGVELHVTPGVGGAAVYAFDPELWACVFPGRAESEHRRRQELAHEGRPRPFPAASLPDDDTLDELARHCDVLALHAYLWRAPPRRLRPELGRYALRRAPWISERHEPHEPDRFRHVRDRARAHGLEVVAYLSPLHSRTTDLAAEARRIVEEYELDGLYLDGLPAGDGSATGAVQAAHDTARDLRAAVGDERILYWNVGDQPLGDPRLSCPFVETWADFVLRGDGGRGGLSLDDFLAYPVRGSGHSNAVGVWCHYGSATRIPLPVELPPSDAAIRAAARHDVRLWRRSRWGRALERFDRTYAASRASRPPRESL